MIRPANAARIAAEITARTEWVMGKSPRAWRGNLLVRLMTMGLDEAIYKSSVHKLYALGTDWRHNAHQLAKAMDQEGPSAKLEGQVQPAITRPAKPKSHV